MEEDLDMDDDTAHLIEEDMKHERYDELPDEKNNNEHTNKSCINQLCSSCCNCYEEGTVSPEYSGNNVICCNGHILMGPLSQFGCVLVSLALILTPFAVYCYILYQVYYIQLNSIVSYIFIMVISTLLLFLSLYFLFKTYLTEPGIIPRASNTQPTYGPLNEHDRFCETCYVIRSAQAKHCSICDNCVDGFDHHCPWTGTCVAERNVRYFVGFVAFTGLLGLVVCVVSIGSLFGANLGTGLGTGLRSEAHIAIMNIFILMYSAIIALMLLGMTVNYIWMIGHGLTTAEQIKYGHRVLTEAERQRREREPENGFKENLYNALYAPVRASAVFLQ